MRKLNEQEQDLLPPATIFRGLCWAVALNAAMAIVLYVLYVLFIKGR